MTRSLQWAAHQLGKQLGIYRSRKRDIGLLFLALSCSILGVGFLLVPGIADNLVLVIRIAGLLWFCLAFLAVILALNRQKVTIVVCTEGLVYSRRNRINVARWESIEEFWKDEGDRHSISSGKYLFRIRLTDGKVLNFDSTIKDGEKLSRLVEREVSNRLLAKDIALLNAGNAVRFDGITVELQEIYVEHKQRKLSLSDIERVNIEDQILDIYRKSERTPWYSVQIKKLPNAMVFDGLLNYILQEFVHMQLPMIIKAYNSGEPIVFGRVGLNLQGVSIDNGKEFIPWHEMQNIEVDQREISINTRSQPLKEQKMPRWMAPNAVVLKGLIDAVLSSRQNTLGISRRKTGKSGEPIV